MTDRELKRRMKQLGIGLLVLMIGIVILSVYTLHSQKADLSVYTNSESTDHLKALGISEDEFLQYLSLAGFLVKEQEEDDVATLQMATNFMETMVSSYEVVQNEEGKKIFDAETIHAIIRELKRSIRQGEYSRWNILYL